MSGLEIDFRVDLRDVELSVRVPQGSTVAVIGPNAAGKSTLLQVAAGWLRPDRGRVLLDGRELTDTSKRLQVPVHRRGLGFLAQSGLLFDHLSVLDNVAFGPRSQGVRRAEARRRAEEWLGRLGVGELAGRRPGQLSGGQAQRVGLARTLAAEPQALLLDEPTSALDVRVAAGLRGLLGEVTRGRTTMLVSHDLLDIVSLADEVVVIECGRVVEVAPTAQLLARPSSAFAARLADVNIIRGRLEDAETLVGEQLTVRGRLAEGSASSGPGLATVRPASIVIGLTEPTTSARNQWPGQIAAMVTMPHAIRVRVDIGGLVLAADVTAAAVAALQLVPGLPVWLSVKAQEVELSALAG